MPGAMRALFASLTPSGPSSHIFDVLQRSSQLRCSSAARPALQNLFIRYVLISRFSCPARCARYSLRSPVTPGSCPSPYGPVSPYSTVQIRSRRICRGRRRTSSMYSNVLGNCSMLCPTSCVHTVVRNSVARQPLGLAQRTLRVHYEYLTLRVKASPKLVFLTPI